MGQLRDRMEEDLKLRNVSPATRKGYLLHARKFVAHYLDAGTELVVIQALLGPRDLRTTALYTHVSVRNIQRTTSPAEHLPPIGAPRKKP